MMNNLKESMDIKSVIYEVRGKQVMLDSDLAYLYGCANGTKDINKAVKRNIERFPSNFYFQLTKEEYDKIKFKDLRFQIGTTNMKRTLPYVFTKAGRCNVIKRFKNEKRSKSECKHNECFCRDERVYYIRQERIISHRFIIKRLRKEGICNIKDKRFKLFKITY